MKYVNIVCGQNVLRLDWPNGSPMSGLVNGRQGKRYRTQRLGWAFKMKVIPAVISYLGFKGHKVEANAGGLCRFQLCFKRLVENSFLSYTVNIKITSAVAISSSSSCS